MKLGSLKSSLSKDGELCVVSRDLKTAVKATHVAPSLRDALEAWKDKEASLQKLYVDLNEGKAENAFPVKESDFHSALPRTWLFADGSAFIYHIKLVRMARKAALPETLETVPLMYQGECGQFLAPTEDIPQRDFAHGTDFEGEVGVITDFVPMGVTPDEALKYIRLFVLINDVSLRGLIPEELAGGFGFFQSKPASALSPFAVTADELGEAYQGGRVHLPLNVTYNGQFFGKANAGAMHFHFGQLIAHAAKTRNLAAGSVIGSGTVSNDDHTNGSSCLAEKRMIEQIETGAIKTPFMKAGDTIEMQMSNAQGQSIFGKISQKVKAV
ncbi:MAG: 2-keto-4-pentenoate hydratase [Bdellovibrio sp. ArHS]|uniref:fumarylacetoacetate hydrolase family protein n=1 Tax=Bdellovibrio sp. ArHS TaxID=1569284 RepID=UPI000583F37F|nr:fumarylacetoacetate hydrolase family protein [Bdellovibrio sp. ArHS]KHD89050.1 MAG: 2-keto-4-pentenoate hydratase [Bdellovibrio sp. ArHS]